ncbi:MAG: MarR family transcriptional regulator [Pseudomonadales bacterium]|jgi:DNA-binding MarR family transcriptional regulator|nr:MarR family transcriptional regulator [Pseudomonadales bacterium]
MRKTELLRRLFREIAILEEAARAELCRQLPDAVSEAQFGVLSHLRYTSNAAETPADLARAFRVSRPAMTQMLARMVRGGLVTLEATPEDRRLRHVRLTKLGREAHEHTLAGLDDAFNLVGRAFRSEALTTLFEQIRHLRLLLEAHSRIEPMPAATSEDERR